MKNTAIYAGTFDPITLGHVDLVERASRLFERVVVGIAESPRKKPLFSLDERVSLSEKVLADFDNVEVQGFNSLLVDFAKKNNANVIVRGLRAVADFDYEFQLATMNRALHAEIESLFLMPSEKYMYVSSSMVREIASLGGDVSAFVAPDIMQALMNKYK